MTQVQILDKAVRISDRTDTPGEKYKSNYSHPRYR